MHCGPARLLSEPDVIVPVKYLFESDPELSKQEVSLTPILPWVSLPFADVQSGVQVKNRASAARGDLGEWWRHDCRSYLQEKL